MKMEKSKIESWFSNIVGKDFKIIDNPKGDFNCVSFTLGIYDSWMWTNEKSWPYQKIPRDSGINGFRKLYELYGYVDCDTSDFEEGYDKIALYSKNGKATHACKQFSDMWRSKLGPSVIIEHKLEWLCGDGEDEYGNIEFIMKRRK